MTETRSIEIPVFRDKEGRPVCWRSNQDCCWLMKRSMWPRQCLATGDKLYYDDDGKGDIIPTPNCPLWRDECNE